MKKKLIYFVMSLSLAVSALGAPLAAHAESLGKIGASQASSRIDTAATNTSTDDSTSRGTRVEEYKKSLKEALTAAAKARIVERCVAAQAVVKLKVTNNTATTTARTTAYEEIVKDLQGVVATATAKNIDVTELEAEITSLQTKITTFKTANTTYQQALADVGALDCKTDPTAFKAALEVARTDQLAVLASAKDIRTYLTPTVKTTLQTLKTKLDSTK